MAVQNIIIKPSLKNSYKKRFEKDFILGSYNFISSTIMLVEKLYKKLINKTTTKSSAHFLPCSGGNIFRAWMVRRNTSVEIIPNTSQSTIRLRKSGVISCSKILARKKNDNPYKDHPIIWHPQYAGNFFIMVIAKISF